MGFSEPAYVIGRMRRARPIAHPEALATAGWKPAW